VVLVPELPPELPETVAPFTGTPPALQLATYAKCSNVMFQSRDRKEKTHHPRFPVQRSAFPGPAKQSSRSTGRSH
jgi:hypothetical protein